ncbi:MAG: metallophosphoesterase [Caulobacterales bacterium]|jgi:3',5'-cyclic AMP phosphodiesterase CpdA
MTDRPFLLAQISDCHVTDRADASNPDAVDRLKRTLAAIGAQGADAIIATGDLVDDGRAAEYALLAEALADAPAPVFLLPGNHDDAATLRRCFPDHAYLPESPPLCWALDHLPLRIVAVDQTMPGLAGGLFMPEHAEWLNETLNDHSDAPTLVALHHPPFSTYTTSDEVGLGGADLFEAVIARHPQVRRIVFGHVHRVILGRVAHADAIACPSTARPFQSRFDGEQTARIEGPPGFLLHAWSRRAGLATHAFTA